MALYSGDMIWEVLDLLKTYSFLFLLSFVQLSLHACAHRLAVQLFVTM